MLDMRKGVAGISQTPPVASFMEKDIASICTMYAERMLFILIKKETCFFQLGR